MYRNTMNRSIYGRGCNANANDAKASADYKTLLLTLETLTQSILTVIDDFFPAISATARLIGNMTAKASMPPMMFVRMYWTKMHPGQIWTNSDYEQLELIDIYLQFPGLDWTSDYLLTVTLN